MTAVYEDYFSKDRPMRYMRYRPGMDVGTGVDEPVSQVEQDDNIGDAALYDLVQVREHRVTVTCGGMSRCCRNPFLGRVFVFVWP